MIYKVSGLFVNTLTTDDKYSLLKRDNLIQLIQMSLPKNKKPFRKFVLRFMKSISTFEHFAKRDDAHSICIFENTDYKKGG